MSDDQALLRAILDNPDDDAPRLIYADWLEEHDDTSRATFIRTQIELDRLPADDPRRDRLVPIERKLWKANRSAWTAWLPRWVRCDRFHRGFLEELRADAADFLAGVDVVRRQAPLMAARLDGPSEIAIPVFRSRALEGLRGLRIKFAIPHMAWEHFAECPYMANVADLDLPSHCASPSMIDALTWSQALPNLRVLRMRSSGVGDELLRELVSTPWCARLLVLDLSGQNLLNRDGAMALVGSPHLEGLQVLNVRGNPLTSDNISREALRKRFGKRVKF